MKKITTLLIGLLSLSISQAQTAEIQIIHNSGDVLATEIVEVWYNDTKLIDSLHFRTATPYLEVPAQTNFDISILPLGGQDTMLAFAKHTFNLDADSNVVAIATGLVSAAPFDSLEPFEIVVHGSRQMAMQSGNTDILVYHGSVDAPDVVVDELTLPMNSILDTLAYGEFSEFLELPTGDYELLVKDAANGEHIASYEAPLSTLNLSDSSMVLLASGFLDTLKYDLGDTVPTVVAKFGLFAVLPRGGNFIPLPVISDIGLPQMSPAVSALYPLPALNTIFIEMPGVKELEVVLFSLDGRRIKHHISEAANEVFEVPISDIPPGNYILRMTSGGQNMGSHKVVIH